MNLILSVLLFISFNNPQKSINIIDALPNGFVKDATVDYTDVIQSCINTYDIVNFPSFPILINDKGLKLRSNSKYYFPKGSLLKLQPSSKSGYNILDCNNKKNILISGAKIQGDANSTTKKGEWGFGISVRGCDNVEIADAIVNNCDGDGIYIGRFDNKISSNITIKNSLVNGCGRNGLSVTSGINVSVQNSKFLNSGDIPPHAGIDIEPNTYQDEIQNINLIGIETGKCKATGLLINLVKLREKNFSASKEVTINISNFTDTASKIGLIIWTNRKNIFSYNPTGTITISNIKLINNITPIKPFNNFINDIKVNINDLVIYNQNKEEAVQLIKNQLEQSNYTIRNYDIK